MPHAVIPFSRKKKNPEPVDPRHRRDGWFDEHDNWHDAESQSPTTAEHILR